MAEIKKSAAGKTADTKTAVEPVAEEAQAEVKETEAKKPAAKKPGRKPAAKKPGRKPAAAKNEAAAKTTTTRKAAVKESVHLQFAGNKDYTPEQLIQSAKDIWKYDLKRKVGDFKSVELYVKPEESVVYYVINGEVEGQFNI